MQKLTFEEIRDRYLEQYKKKLGMSDENLRKRLEGEEIFQEDGGYYINVEGEQECGKIIERIQLYDKASSEDDVIKKYEMLLDTLPPRYSLLFPDTIGLHHKYVVYLIQRRKEKNLAMMQAFHGLRTMLSLMDKELTECSDSEMVELIRDERFTSTTRQYAVWFTRYVYSQHPERLQSDVEMSMLRREKIKENIDFYTEDEWNAFAECFFDTKRHLEHAFKNCTYARYWLYAILHMSLAWRKSDVLNIPALNNLPDISRYTQKLLGSDGLSRAEAQRIINQVKLLVEQYLIKKTGLKKHFNIPQIAVVPTATALIICEHWRRKKGDEMLFGKFDVERGRIRELFALETDFLSIRANRTLLSMFNEKAGELSEFSGRAGCLTSYMRSHKASKKGNANITTVYLHSTYDERESASMGKQVIDRGAFGYVYDRLLELTGNKKSTFRENTELIVKMQDIVPVETIEGISGALHSITNDRELFLAEIYSWHEDEIKEKAELLFAGKLLSRTDDIYCLMQERCPYPTEDQCMLCRYSIPTTYSLTMVGEELIRVLTQISMTSEEDRLDRINFTYQIGKLIMIIKEAIDRFGHEYIETYINYKEINELIQAQTPKMIFLEDRKYDRRE